MIDGRDKAGDDAIRLTRQDCSYTNCSKRFILSNRSFDRQYASYYNARLRVHLGPLKKKARMRWGSAIPIKRLCDLIPDEEVIVIGTLYKHMELRPSILKEISEQHHLIPQQVKEEFASDADFLILEDELQRIVIIGHIDPQCHVTGVIIAIRGAEQEDGKFVVQDVCYSTARPPMKRSIQLKNDKFVLIISGLGFGLADILFPFQMMIDYLSGELGCERDRLIASSIVRIIIAGNCLGERLKDKDFSTKAKYLSRKVKVATADSMKCFDEMLSRLAMSIDVDVMPGEHDPANHLMPQQPLHLCMFPRAARYSTFHTVTNPYEAQIGGLKFLGSSGQNIKDISAYSRLDEPLDILEKTLIWGHMSPTAPDTLNCYPFADEDPFVMSECPNVYFCGNMSELGVKKFGPLENPVTMVCVPRFCDTYTAALVNLRTIEVEPFVFEA